MRIGLWVVVVLVVVPRRLFRPPSGQRAPEALADGVRMLVAIALTSWVLVLLHLFDLFSLIGSLGLLLLGRTFVRSQLSPRELARAAWRRAVRSTLHLIDGGTAAGATARLVGRQLLDAVWDRRPRGGAARWAAAEAAVVAVAVGSRMVDVLLHPAPTQPGEFVQHVTGIAAVADRQFPTGAIGADLILGALSRMVTVDIPILVRVAGPVLAGILTLTVMRAARQAGSDRWAAVLAGLAVASVGIASWAPPETTPPLQVQMLLIIAVAGCSTLHRAATDTTAQRRHTYAVGLCGLLGAFVTPALGLVLVAGWAAACVVHWAMRIPSAIRRRNLAIAAMTGWMIGTVPIAVAGTLGGGATPFFGEPSTLPSWFATAAAAAALVAILVAPGRNDADRLSVGDVDRAVTPTATLVVAFFVSAEMFSADSLEVAAAAPLLVPLGAVSAAIAMTLTTRWMRQRVPPDPAGRFAREARFGMAGLAIAALGVATFQLQLVDPGPRLHSDVLAETLFDIRSGFPANSWTVVSEESALPVVEGRGFWLSDATFADTYDPTRWQFDPRAPELAVPSRHTFIVVPTADTGSSGATRRSELVDWIDDYRRTHDDMTLWADRGDTQVWHIDRPPARDEELLDQIARGEAPPPD